MFDRERIDRIRLGILRALGQAPMCRVMKELRARGLDPERMHALEAFAREGAWHTVDYAGQVASLTAWEIDPAMEPGLRKNLPHAERKITDAYREILVTERRFDLIVVDAPVLPHASRCEHFDFVPLVFRVSQDPFVLIVNVVARANRSVQRKFRDFWSEHHLQARKAFYQCRDPTRLTRSEIVAAYGARAREHGHEIEWSFLSRYDRLVDYFVMKLRRSAGGALTAGEARRAVTATYSPCL